MSNTDFPEGIHVLKPRKVSVSRELDSFLDATGLAHPESAPLSDKTRPKAGSLNAMLCADCGQVEYLTREYCRCGHYLGGQLQDEYLALEQSLHARHAELSEEAERTLKPLRFYYLLAVPFIIVPALHAFIWFDSFALSTFLWWMPAMLIAGAGMFAENLVIRPLKESNQLVNNYTFDVFLLNKYQLPSKLFYEDRPQANDI